VRHRNTATRVEGSLLRSRSIFLGDMHGSRRHISNNVTVTLILRLARRVYVHLEMPNTSVIGEGDFRVTLAHAWKPIDLVACKFIPPTRYAFDRKRILSKPCDESIALFGPGAARRNAKKEKIESLH